MEKNINTHWEFIDITKGVSILLVILSHAYSPLMSWASAFFIPVFFVTSGYCSRNRVNVKKKFLTLIIPYIVFTCILFIIYWTFQPVNFLGAIYSRWCLYPIDSTGNVYLLRSGNGPLWFLTSMFISFLIWSVIQRSKRQFILLGMCLLISYTLTFLPILLPWSIDTAFFLAIFIAVGEKIKKFSILDKFNVYFLLFFVCVYIILSYICGEVNLSVREYGTSIFILFPTAIIGSILLLKISYYLEQTIIGHIFAKIGKHSLPIFCLHIPLLDIWSSFFESFMPNLNPMIVGIVTTIIILICVYPFAVFINTYILPTFISVISISYKK
ncbi:acyltransferase family protein [uncultured Prevotella sp.]|uniref:acyltransferase family protein n=1 Tax=uncultured Prevotella sp. TaxID=159272 RepID=UPI0025E441A3|nr:acyltransferase family protein [uncultured Prevotella sp.]